MTTLLTVLDIDIGADTGLGAITLPTPQELSLLALPGLVEWWSPYLNIEGARATFRWGGLKENYPLVPKAPPVAPTMTTLGSKKFAKFTPDAGGQPSEVGAVYSPAGQVQWPADASYTIAVVGCSTTKNGPLIGTGISNLYASIQHANSRVFLRHRNGSASFLQSSNPHAAGTPMLVVVSYDKASGARVMRINGIVEGSDTTQADPVIPANLFLGSAAGETYQGATTLPNVLSDGYVGDTMVFDRALHLDVDAIGLVETYLKAKFGLAV